MFFYDNNFKPIEVLVTQKINHQYNSHYVYRTLDGRVLKVFRIFDIGPDLELEKKIQALQLTNLFTIDEYLFNEQGIYNAFLMPFYESCPDDILLKPSDYIADNFSSIFRSFNRLADEKITTTDANYENTIFSKDKIIIIDSERYREELEEDIDYIRNSNYTDACWILYWALIKAASTHPEFDGKDLYNWFYTTKPDGQTINCDISKYKYPIDYLRRIKRKI